MSIKIPVAYATPIASAVLIRTFLPNASEVYFAGVMDFSRLSFLNQFIAKMDKAVKSAQRDCVKICTLLNAVLS